MVSNTSWLSLNSPSPQAMLKTDLVALDGQLSTLLGGGGLNVNFLKIVSSVQTLMTRIVGSWVSRLHVPKLSIL